MNLRQIEMFRAIMATGSFTAAAELLHISQPGVSLAARHLETQLGVILFTRTSGRIRPTADAVALSAEIERSYRGVKSIQEFAEGLRNGANSVLRIGASANVALQVVPRAISQLVSQGSQASFSLETLRGPLLTEALLREQVDIGITSMPLEHPLLSSRLLGYWRLVCVYPAGHPLEAFEGTVVDKALEFPLVTFTTDTPQGRTAEAWFENSKPHRLVQVRSGLTACTLVASGAGIAFVDDLTACFFEPQGLRWRGLPESPEFPIYAVWSSNIPLALSGVQFCDRVESELKGAAAG
ncbi:LysR family transcriptional regulator [soil metagenome]